MSGRSKKLTNYLESEDEEDANFYVRKRQKQQSSSKKKRLLRNNEADDYEPQQELNEESTHLQDFIVDDSDDQKQSRRKKQKKQTKSVRSTNPKRTSQKKGNQGSKTQQTQQEDPDEQEIQYNEREIDMQASHISEELFKEMEARLPIFLQPENIRDNNQRAPDHPDYDSSSLYIPEEEYQKFTPMFKQYWNAKMQNFDKILFFRFGRWLHTFYTDALLIGQMFNCRIGFWGSSRPCLCIYDSQYPVFGRTLVEKGFKLMIIEQIEKGELVLKDTKERIAKREITQIISRSTFYTADMTYEPRNIMTIIEEGNTISVAIVDVTTNHFQIDSFSDKNTLRTLITKVRPLELAVIVDKITEDTLKMIKHICAPQVMQSKRDFKDMNFIFRQFKKEFMEVEPKHKNQMKLEGIFKENEENTLQININEGIYEENKEEEPPQTEDRVYLSHDYPPFLLEWEKQYNYDEKEFSKKEQLVDQKKQEKIFFTYYYHAQSLYLLLHYLRLLKESETIYRRGTFEFLDSSLEQLKHLYLDSAALESLEIFQVNLSTRLTEKGSLFHYINQCGTYFGKRLLKKWLTSPLFNTQELLKRQAAIIELKEIAMVFIKSVKSLPDIERSIIRIFNSISASKLRAVAFSGETFGQSRLKELSSLLNQLKEAAQLINIFKNENFKSNRLIQLTNIKKKNSKGLFPDITNALKELEKCLIFKDGQPQPAFGVSEEYDIALKNQEHVLSQFDEELEYWRKKLNCKDINYFHGRHKFQIEVPDRFVEGNLKPAEFTISSKKKDFQRFYTDKIEDLKFQLKMADDKLYKSLVPFLQEYFEKFYSQRQLWYQLVSCLAELDCLCALSIVSDTMKPRCIPRILQALPDEEIKETAFDLKGAVHPCLMIQEGNWVPNDIHFDAKVDTLLLTGPNMSGKSTILRLSAICIILAQIGCSVPAEEFTLLPFDRIFSRLGASDRLLEGKSTFFIEMEETQIILENASARSLVVIDELGRGTSTYDGVAIASAVLRNLTTQSRPKMLFATHYHILLDEFALFSNIKQCVMQHEFSDNEVKFHYKLIEGFCERSFASNVARIAGVPNEVVKKSIIIGNKITKEEEKMKMSRSIIKEFNKNIEDIFKN